MCLTTVSNIPAKAQIIKEIGENGSSITIAEGHNRQVRKMCEVCGLEVRRLVRAEGQLKLGSLPCGQMEARDAGGGRVSGRADKREKGNEIRPVGFFENQPVFYLPVKFHTRSI